MIKCEDLSEFPEIKNMEKVKQQERAGFQKKLSERNFYIKWWWGNYFCFFGFQSISIIQEKKLPPKQK